MGIRFAGLNDLEKIAKYDKHISLNQLKISISQRQVFIAEDNNRFVGWLRYNLFWDNTPFMNLLFVLQPFRGRGVGKSLVLYFENEMKDAGFECVMTSTSSTETAKYFYEKFGYKDVGGFNYLSDPYEIIYLKKL